MSVPLTQALGAMNSIGVFTLLAALLLSGCDRMDLSFSDYRELAEADAMQSGWFPVWLPESAYDIRESHDIDTNQSMLVFRVRERAWRPPSDCLGIAPGNAPPAPYSRPWWPAEKDFEARPGISFYSCQDNVYVAVDDPNHLVFHWRPSGI